MIIIGGLYRGQKLKSPRGAYTRPTANRLREAIFNICQNEIGGSHFLDIFAGSGAMGLEAISRGAESATFIEFHKDALQCIESNVQTLGVKEKTAILRGDVFSKLRSLEQQEKKFNLIYADPPYQTAVPGQTDFYSTCIVKWFDDHCLLTADGLLLVEEKFTSQPILENLNHLSLKNCRRFGDSALQIYHLKSI